MQTLAVFPLWPRLHQDLVRFLDRTPDTALAPGLSPGDGDLGAAFRHIAAVEQHWRRVVLDGAADYQEIRVSDCPDRAALRARLGLAFEELEQLLRGSLVAALAERPVRTRFPVKNALEALSLGHIHTVHHRAQIAVALRTLGIDPEDWI